MTPFLWIAALIVIVGACALALYLAELAESSNYERDEIPPPERTVSPQDWREHR